VHVAAMANMMILFFLFSEGKTEDNLTHIFNLFDADGNKVSSFTTFPSSSHYLHDSDGCQKDPGPHKHNIKSTLAADFFGTNCSCQANSFRGYIKI
jgi:hypothetical protein